MASTRSETNISAIFPYFFLFVVLHSNIVTWCLLRNIFPPRGDELSSTIGGYSFEHEMSLNLISITEKILHWVRHLVSSILGSLGQKLCVQHPLLLVSGIETETETEA